MIEILFSFLYLIYIPSDYFKKSIEYYKNHLLFEASFGNEIRNYLDLRELNGINFIAAKKLIESKKKLNKTFLKSSEKKYEFNKLFNLNHDIF